MNKNEQQMTKNQSSNSGSLKNGLHQRVQGSKNHKTKSRQSLLGSSNSRALKQFKDVKDVIGEVQLNERQFFTE